MNPIMRNKSTFQILIRFLTPPYPLGGNQFFKAVPFLLVLLISTPSLATTLTYACSKKDCHIQNSLKVFNLEQDNLNHIQSVAKSTVSELLSKDVTHVGALSLAELENKIASLVQWKFLASGYLAPQGRLSGFRYTVEDHTVVFEADTVLELLLARRTPQIANLILLHESLGALGYIDDDYQISSTLAALNSLNPSELDSVKKMIPAIQFDLTIRNTSPSGGLRSSLDPHSKEILAAGGSTTTGGGGDAYSAFIKMQLVRLALLQQESLDTLQFLTQKVRIERPILYYELHESGLTPIYNYPLKYEDFLKSVQMTNENNKTLVLIALPRIDYIHKIENHVLKLLQSQHADQMQ